MILSIKIFSWIISITSIILALMAIVIAIKSLNQAIANITKANAIMLKNITSKMEIHFMNRALITGITGQDGSYLTEFLLEKDYEVHGIIRRSSYANTRRIDHLTDNPRLHLHYGDMTDSGALTQILQRAVPDEVYNLAAQSHVRVSFDMPIYTGEVNALGTIRLLEAIRKTGLNPRFYQASTSELYGNAIASPQNEDTPFLPRSPYGAAKLYAYWATVNFRESYDMYCCNGILFNHESPRRELTFVTRKITNAAAAIYHGDQRYLYLGNLDAKRDWGYAPDYVRAMWMMLQPEKPDDYVIATGESHSVREFVDLAFLNLGMHIRWSGSGINEIGRNINNKTIIRIDPRYYRPAEVNHLVGDASKARKRIGWESSITFERLVEIMMDAEMEMYADNRGHING